MSKIKTKELIICIITVAILVLTIVTDVFATDEPTDWNALMANMNSANTIENTNTTNTTNTTNNINTINSVNNTNTVNNTKNTNNTTTMPNTGVDYSVVFIIAVCGISAIYAYKKIRDYNNF